MILQEQFLKNRNRVLWRGSIYKNWDSTKTSFGCPYVTTDVLYALNFSKDLRDPIVGNAQYLTQFVIKKPLNLFNARSKKDTRKLEDYFRTHNMFSWLGTLPLLADNDWLDVFEYEEKEHLIEILKELDFDGFVNIECNGGSIQRNAFKTLDVLTKNDLYGFDGIGIFDIQNLQEVKTLKGWDEIKKEYEVKLAINSAKEAALKLLFEHWSDFENDESYFLTIAPSQDIIWRLLSEKDLDEIFSNFDYESFKKVVEKEKNRLREVNRPLIAFPYLKLFEKL